MVLFETRDGLVHQGIGNPLTHARKNPKHGELEHRRIFHEATDLVLQFISDCQLAFTATSSACEVFLLYYFHYYLVAGLSTNFIFIFL